MELREIWQALLSRLEDKIPSTSIETWLKPSELTKLENNRIILRVPNKFYKSWISENFEPIIRDELKSLLGLEDAEINYEVSSTNGNRTKEKLTELREKPVDQVNLNPKYTFENFVIGPSNQFAHASALAVTEKPGKVYNPLFIYGGVGLGKTHLLHAIGHKVNREHPNLRIIYTSAEKFMNELIDSIKNDKMAHFRKKYRKTDVLLIDDIQFIAGKDRTQEEFFHTFNELHNEGKQIVLSSDRPPAEMDHIEERLKSRFQWGLIADIKPPDLETRIAILKKKAESEGIQLPDDVAYLIAKRIRTNVRELEGCLVKISAMASLLHKKIDIDTARHILDSMYPYQEEDLSPNAIIKMVAERFEIKISDIKSKKRTKNIVLPRQIAMYLIRKVTTLSLPEIGELFGGMDHSSVHHGIKKVENLLKTDQKLKSIVEELERKLEL
ncbi:chromosomal replication initiator protein [Thermosulfidibacter takaii ABI70S6]|uniref:Chromosomal replication initiator protein DnaA n=1 Tax=Thermosulfidibacter takaii (strain DSM 17441 / JCM 13301 / NBRC 103674 / ABI70S6) TaxID=1298851 RepID=A0A0S3QR56_THET7|nr:chromosomal replication initiator protein DnaA [Thermosulfidibacter takaii]BAT70812.1 chromosomal replication initiator protein [Thermosulfidibacter takaii ABI70S6]